MITYTSASAIAHQQAAQKTSAITAKQAHEFAASIDRSAQNAVGEKTQEKGRIGVKQNINARNPENGLNCYENRSSAHAKKILDDIIRVRRGSCEGGFIIFQQKNMPLSLERICGSGAEKAGV